MANPAEFIDRAIEELMKASTALKENAGRAGLVEPLDMLAPTTTGANTPNTPEFKPYDPWFQNMGYGYKTTTATVQGKHKFSNFIDKDFRAGRTTAEIIIHCSATSPNWKSNKASWAKAKEIHNWHVTRSAPFSQIGYHFLVDRDGTIIKGRDLKLTGAHVRGHNTGTIGICLIGGRSGTQHDSFNEHFTLKQEASLDLLIMSLLRDNNDITKLSGHNQFAAKACPCFKVNTTLPSVKQYRSKIANNEWPLGIVRGNFALAT